MTAPSLNERLRLGVIEHRRRWSGDTHADLGGSVDVTATEALMREAAAELERLESQLEAAAVRLAKPAHHEPPYVDGYFGER